MLKAFLHHAVRNGRYGIIEDRFHALRNEATVSVIYTPPEGQELLRDKLANWERYIHEADDVDPLIRLAVMHYQFEAIHPFIDGNGRTGRVLNLPILGRKGLAGHSRPLPQ